MNAVLGDIAHAVRAMCVLYGKPMEDNLIQPKGSYSLVIDNATKLPYNLYIIKYNNHS